MTRNIKILTSKTFCPPPPPPPPIITVLWSYKEVHKTCEQNSLWSGKIFSSVLMSTYYQLYLFFCFLFFNYNDHTIITALHFVHVITQQRAQYYCHTKCTPHLCVLYMYSSLKIYKISNNYVNRRRNKNWGELCSQGMSPVLTHKLRACLHWSVTCTPVWRWMTEGPHSLQSNRLPQATNPG